MLEDTSEINERLLDDVLHLTESEAVAKIKEVGLTSRITSRNGNYFPVIRNYRTDRINLDLQEGKVIKATIG